MCGFKPCDCNGKLLSAAEIDSYFSYLAQKRKKNGTTNAASTGTNSGGQQQANVQQQPGPVHLILDAPHCEEIYNCILTEEMPAGDDEGI